MGGAAGVPEQSNESLSEQLKQFGPIYWVANWMELVERFAYYGVRVVLPVFMVAALEDDGPQLTHIQKGTIYSVWAIVQSFVPILSGGFADRYGYKLNIAISTVLKIIGYLLMGYCIVMAESMAGMPIAEARALGSDLTYEFFFVGAMFLAVGTGVFKPGVQGLIANQMPKSAASLGWGMFYQMVNIGGFLGPLIAGYLRVLDWKYVFLTCSAGIALNFIPLFFFKEPERKVEPDPGETPILLLYRAIKGLLEPRLFFFTISFAGFWLMFYQLFDILPNFIDDWVDSRGIAAALSSVLPEGAVPTVNGGNITQEWMINANAALISLFAFAMGYLTGKVRSLSAIIVGIGISAIGIFMLGLSMSGWMILGAIACFSVGEMAASPTKMRYMAQIAPPGKEGLYMGYANFTTGIGWSIGSIVAGEMYETGGDKINLAKRWLVDNNHTTTDVLNGMDRSDILPFFEKTMNVDAWGARQLLWDAYSPQAMWQVFMLIGLCAMAAIVAYNQLILRSEANPKHSFNLRGDRWVKAALFPIVGIFWYFTYLKYSHGLMLNGTFFTMMLIVSLTAKPDSPPNAPTPGTT
jgi:dipeptide/tripeptide permease